METPKAVIKAASSLIRLLDSDSFRFLGEYEGREAWLYVMPNKMYIGFPFVYLYSSESEKVTEVTGEDSLRIISLLDGE